MPPDFKPANCNMEFAREVIRSYVLGYKNFEFNSRMYVTNDYIDQVREDIINGRYRIKLTDKLCFNWRKHKRTSTL